MKPEWTQEEKDKLIQNIGIIKRFYARGKSSEEIADMMELSEASIELIINLIDDGFYPTNKDLAEAAIILW